MSTACRKRKATKRSVVLRTRGCNSHRASVEANRKNLKAARREEVLFRKERWGREKNSVAGPNPWKFLICSPTQSLTPMFCICSGQMSFLDAVQGVSRCCAEPEVQLFLPGFLRLHLSSLFILEARLSACLWRALLGGKL